MKVIATKKAPSAIGPYSQGIVTNGFIYTSGQLGIHPLTGELEEGIIKQTHQAIQNISEILMAGGSSLDKVVKTTVYVQDLKDFATVNEIYMTYFKTNPARSCVEVSKLPKGALIEIEVIAEV